MSITETGLDNAKMQQRQNEVFDVWVKSHLSGLVTELPFDPDNEHQRIGVVHIKPNPSLEMARQFGEASMGTEAYGSLISELRKKKIAEQLGELAAKGKNSLIASLHLQSTLDTAITHNSLFVASGNSEFASRNIVLANPLMARMAIGGIPVMEVLGLSGHIILGIPAERARAYGMQNEIVEFVNRKMSAELSRMLEEGIILHQALSGTRAKQVILSDGASAKVIPRVSDSSARMARKRTPVVVGVPMNVKAGNSSAKVYEPRTVTADGDVHELMEEMVEDINKMAGENVFYGMPEGARLA